MKRYTKVIDGKAVTKYAKQIIVCINGKQIINPSEEMILNDGWIEEVIKNPFVKEETLEDVINDKLQDIENYDESDNVNICYISMDGQTIPYWANKSERSSLKTAIQDSLLQNRTTYRLDLRDINISITIPCEVLMQMLSQLEVYAIDCYNKTTDHIFAVKSLKNIDEIKSYDHTTGYPEKLTFNI